MSTSDLEGCTSDSVSLSTVIILFFLEQEITVVVEVMKQTDAVLIVVRVELVDT